MPHWSTCEGHQQAAGCSVVGSHAGAGVARVGKMTLKAGAGGIAPRLPRTTDHAATLGELQSRFCLVSQACLLPDRGSGACAGASAGTRLGTVEPCEGIGLPGAWVSGNCGRLERTCPVVFGTVGPTLSHPWPQRGIRLGPMAYVMPELSNATVRLKASLGVLGRWDSFWFALHPVAKVHHDLATAANVGLAQAWRAVDRSPH